MPNRPELSLHAGDEGADGVTIRDVELAVQRGTGRGDAVAGGHREAVGCQPLCDRGAQAPGGSGHDRDSLIHRPGEPTGRTSPG